MALIERRYNSDSEIRTLPAGGTWYNLHFGGASRLVRTIAPPNCITICQRNRLLRAFPRTCSKLSERECVARQISLRRGWFGPQKCRHYRRSTRSAHEAISANLRHTGSWQRPGVSETNIPTVPRRADFRVSTLNWQHQFSYCQTFDFCSILIRFPKQPLCLVTLAAINPANG